MSESSPKISHDRLTYERALLLPLRNQHAQQLLGAGTIQRMCASYGRSFLQPPAPVSGVDELLPFRKPTELKVFRRLANKNDTIITAQQEINSLEQGRPYELYVHRVSPEPIATRSTNFFIGDLLTGELANEYGLNRYIPAFGMEEPDVALVAKQLEEIAEVVTAHGLTSINTETLIEDPATLNVE